MKLLEIKNNLIKLSYEEDERPVLGKFLVLASDEKSYVAQFVNLKSDSVNNFAIARLLFTFTSDGVVDNYDGSIPSMGSELSMLSSDELLDLLPIETPIKIAPLAQQDSMLNLDISCFEHNFTVFTSHNSHKISFISNCVRQLFQMKEKSVIIDDANLFEDYPKIEFTKDFKLPLNSEMIDYIFEYELAEVDASTKAVIQDIFYAVQQYIKSLDFEFLPIDNFVDVVTKQYKETQMPELALLKNKLLKYRDANVFANTKEEVLVFNEKIKEKNCSIIDVKDVNESLQKEVISFVHNALNSIEKFIYFFVPLNDWNSDKKLLKKLVNHSHIFTTFLADHSYKYANELKAFAENILLFAPQAQQNDFASYNTFLSKLNLNEAIVYGKLTQGIPFIVEMSDLDLDLTKDDVLGDRVQFVPKTEDTILVRIDENGNKILLDDSFVPVDENGDVIPTTEETEEPVIEEEQTETSPIQESVPAPVEEVAQNPQPEVQEEELVLPENELVEDSTISDDVIEYPEIPEEEVDDLPQGTQVLEPSAPQIIEPVANIMEETEPLSIEEDDLTIDEGIQEESLSETDDNVTSELTEDDLDFIEGQSSIEEPVLEEPEPLQTEEENFEYQESPYVEEEQTPVVPVYPTDEINHNSNSEDEDGVGFAQGDTVTHPRYGRGVVEKIIKYGNKTLCSISFENVGRRLLDPSVSEFTKV